MRTRINNGISDLRKAAIHRKRDAWRLYDPDRRPARFGMHARGALYLAGYAIECKLKAIAMEVYGCRTLDELIRVRSLDDRSVYTHGLETLGSHVPALWARFRQSDVWSDFSRRVNRWRPSWRYDPRTVSPSDAGEFLNSVERIFQWFESNRG